jgi:hypothetical protein
LLAGCATPHPPPPPPRPVAARPAPLDWFQRQMVAARQARAAHQPASDTAGAQAAYDDVVRAACTRVAISGPEKYQARCAAILRRTQSPASEPVPCDPSSTDPTELRACND